MIEVGLWNLLKAFSNTEGIAKDYVCSNISEIGCRISGMVGLTLKHGTLKIIFDNMFSLAEHVIFLLPNYK